MHPSPYSAFVSLVPHFVFYLYAEPYAATTDDNSNLCANELLQKSRCPAETARLNILDPVRGFVFRSSHRIKR